MMTSKKPKITPIKVDKEKLEKLKAQVTSKDITPFKKRDAIKQLTGECCKCGGIASKIISYDVVDATRIERYCDKCYS